MFSLHKIYHFSSLFNVPLSMFCIDEVLDILSIELVFNNKAKYLVIEDYLLLILPKATSTIDILQVLS